MICEPFEHILKVLTLVTVSRGSRTLFN